MSIFDRVMHVLSGSLEQKPERLTAAEYREWFKRAGQARSEAAEYTDIRGAWGSVPTRRSIAIWEKTFQTLQRMDADPVALRDQAARDEIIITD